MFKKYNNDRIASAIFGLIVLVGMLMYFRFNVAENTGKEYTPPHEDWTPQDSLEDKEPDAIYYDDMLDVDMDCGGSYYDSIPEYSSFNYVPASVDTVINVGGIIYKTNNNKTSWIPIYKDEYVMWVGDNGDTIWE